MKWQYFLPSKDASEVFVLSVSIFESTENCLLENAFGAEIPQYNYNNQVKKG